MKKLLYLLAIVFSLAGIPDAHAQPTEQLVRITVVPDHDDWTYRTGEKAGFNVTITRHGHPLKNTKVKYELGLERMPAAKADSLSSGSGTFRIDGGTLDSPGFLRCVVTAEVDGKRYRGLATAGFDPQLIKTTTNMPVDFKQFWDQAKAENSKIPMDARMTLLPERCTETVNVYHVSLQNYRAGSRLFGILCVPKKEGKYPALLRVPGAGIRPYNGDIATAEKGVITLEIGIHGIPVNLDASQYAYLAAGALSGYQTFNLEDKDRYYYKRVYLGCVRANDFLTSLPQYDGKTLGVTGGSQGGALSIITAGLDPRVKFLGAYYPALSDLTGYLHGRTGGWPHMFSKDNINSESLKDKIRTTGYYDVVNFARQVTVPGQYSWGFNDETCPPTSMYAAYNLITAPKSLKLYLETGHWQYPEQREMMEAWLLGKLK